MENKQIIMSYLKFTAVGRLCGQYIGDLGPGCTGATSSFSETSRSSHVSEAGYLGFLAAPVKLV